MLTNLNMDMTFNTILLILLTMDFSDTPSYSIMGILHKYSRSLFLIHTRLQQHKISYSQRTLSLRCLCCAGPDPTDYSLRSEASWCCYAKQNYSAITWVLAGYTQQLCINKQKDCNEKKMVQRYPSDICSSKGPFLFFFFFNKWTKCITPPPPLYI